MLNILAMSDRMSEIQFNNFLKKLTGPDITGHIIAIYEFGSGYGITHPEISDVDLFIVTKTVGDIPIVLNRINELEENILHWPHSATKDFIEKHFLGSNDIGGLHLILISKEELKLGRIKKHRRLQGSFVKSLRLRLLTGLLISEYIFLYKIKNQAKLVFGDEVLDNMQIPRPGAADRIKSFTLSFVVLLLAPLTLFNEFKFKVWCFKATKYYMDCIETYYKMTGNNNRSGRFNNLFYSRVKASRYTPEQYHSGRLKLYLATWYYLFRNLNFIWKP